MEAIRKEPGRGSYYLGKLKDFKYLTLRHRGYVFVMYGSENPEKSTAVHGSSVAEAAPKEISPESSAPVDYRINLPSEIVPGREYIAEVTFSFGDGWHGYSDDTGNIAMGFIPTHAGFLFPEGVDTGTVAASDEGVIYEGSVGFRQSFICQKTISGAEYELPVTVKLQWQACNESMCLPPEERTFEMILKIKHP